jgi:hypothetical protein
MALCSRPLGKVMIIEGLKNINDEAGDGFVGFIHNCVIDDYLNHHEAQMISNYISVDLH